MEKGASSIKPRRILRLVFILGLCSSMIGPGMLYAAERKSNGIHDEHYSTGEKRYKSSYKDGKLDGITIEYDKAGEVIGKYKFKDGRPIKKYEKEPKRNVGRLGFVFKWWFLLSVVVVVVGLWFIFTKVILKGKF